ncbi:MAG TPA: alpha-amylase/4-alpha-glucanotransferase domain-containing protein, partial [Gemmatimonadales bacterium]|nr:alpha-amylase/4-alpha-glucanotransferase domain-containing protein [Gemmatimonadales bacterium]
NYPPVRSWAQASCSYRIGRTPDRIEIECWFTSGAGGERSLEKRLTFTPDGSIAVAYAWDHSAGSRDDFFASEISLFAPLELRTQPAAEVWTFPIETTAKSERGFDRTRQGDSVTLRWPVHLGRAAVVLDTKVPALVE